MKFRRGVPRRYTWEMPLSCDGETVLSGCAAADSVLTVSSSVIKIVDNSFIPSLVNWLRRFVVKLFTFDFYLSKTVVLCPSLVPTMVHLLSTLHSVRIGRKQETELLQVPEQHQHTDDLRKDDERNAEPEPVVERLVMPELHAQPRANTASKQGQTDERRLFYAPAVMLRLELVDAEQAERQDIDRSEVDKGNMQECDMHPLIKPVQHARHRS